MIDRTIVFRNILKQCIVKRDLRIGRSLHALYFQLLVPQSTYFDNHFILVYSKCNCLKAAENAFKQTQQPNVFTYNCLLDAYAKESLVTNAQNLFDEIPNPDLVSFNTLISAYADRGDTSNALRLFNAMREVQVGADGFTLSSVLNASLSDVWLIKQLHCSAVVAGFDSYSSVNNSLVTGYSKNGNLEHSKQVFSEMGHSARDVVSWNSMIGAYGKNGETVKALAMLQEMTSLGHNVDAFTLATILTALTGEKDLFGGFQFHSTLIKFGFHQNCLVGSALIDLYAKCRVNMLECQKVFDDVCQSDLVLWNSMISGYSMDEELSEQALSFFIEMQRAGFKPDDCSFVCAFRACSHFSSPRRGKQFHALVVKSDIPINQIQVYNSLITMYARCGSLPDSRLLFDRMLEHNEVSFCAMISAYAQHGIGSESIQLFQQMMNKGFVPSSIAFISILSACAHSGLVEEGQAYFDMMKKRYGIEPNANHYLCMIDLLGRAGKLGDARRIAETMPFSPGSAAWASLLGASRTHQDSAMAEIAATEIMKIDPANATPYVMLSNIYSAAGMWSKVSDIRRLMRKMVVRKSPGSSWIETNKTVHVFVAGDSSHPMIKEIHRFLDEMFSKMKLAGYVPEKRWALAKDEIEDSEREKMLRYHSEKLAIGFGLLSTKSVEPIIVMKNLRICGDCHTAIKFMSTIAGRTIVVRDAHRFHCFKDGHCSCRDYW